MLLVIDVNKGIQTQTAECLVIGEITKDKMIVVLNKVDLLPEKERDEKLNTLQLKTDQFLSLRDQTNALLEKKQYKAAAAVSLVEERQK